MTTPSFDDLIARWQARLPPGVPRDAVARFLADEGPDLRLAFDAAREHHAAEAFDRWLAQRSLAGHDFDDSQLQWLAAMHRQILDHGALTPCGLGREPFLARGGEDKAVRLFGRRTLDELLTSMNAAFATTPGSCACGGACSKAPRCACTTAPSDPTDPESPQ